MAQEEENFGWTAEGPGGGRGIGRDQAAVHSRGFCFPMNEYQSFSTLLDEIEADQFCCGSSVRERLDTGHRCLGDFSELVAGAASVRGITDNPRCPAEDQAQDTFGKTTSA